MQAALEQFSKRRLNNAVSTALTRTAKDVQAAEKQAIREQIDRPREFTVNSVAIEPATGEKLFSRVFLKVNQGSGRGAGKYMMPQITGGSGHLRGYEVALQRKGMMPTGWRIAPGGAAKLDNFGNISKGTLDAVFRNLVLEGPRKPPKRASKRGPMRWFYLLKQRGRLMPGVYIVEGAKGPRQVLRYESSLRFKKRYDFWGVASKTAREKFPEQFNRACQESLARLASRK